MFIFGRCPWSTAAVTPVKYEHDLSLDLDHDLDHDFVISLDFVISFRSWFCNILNIYDREINKRNFSDPHRRTGNVLSMPWQQENQKFLQHFPVKNINFTVFFILLYMVSLVNQHLFRENPWHQFTLKNNDSFLDAYSAVPNSRTYPNKWTLGKKCRKSNSRLPVLHCVYCNK